ncbi:hypothetical protein SpCBS45565_g00771 [Spizellomyces sp. 'palustris']|nr:hypothetical protein SpCBS45565_g00771 [Spizellomyces sp. 'palustris']
MNSLRPLRALRPVRVFSATLPVSARIPVGRTSSILLSNRRQYSTEDQKATNGEQASAKQGEQPAQEEQAPEADTAVVLAEKDKQIAALQDMYRRALADAENVRQRARKEVAETKEFAINKFAKDLLSTADVLELALKAVPETERGENASNQHLKDLYTGVAMTRSNLMTTFKRFGIEPFEPLGETFDPNLHEALFQAPIPGKEPGTVFDVAKTGYKLGSRILRPAQVGVVQDTS